jgi:hypothetical protein
LNIAGFIRPRGKHSNLIIRTWGLFALGLVFPLIDFVSGHPMGWPTIIVRVLLHRYQLKMSEGVKYIVPKRKGPVSRPLPDSKSAPG